MKRLTPHLVAAAVALALTGNASAQHVIRAISLGDPIPAYQPDPNLKWVNGFTQPGVVTLGFQACCEPSKETTGARKDAVVHVPCDCKSAAPSCAVAAKPWKGWQLPKLLQHAQKTACANGAAPCSAACACVPAKAAPPNVAAAPAPTTAPATCASCSDGHKTYRRPILEAVKNFVKNPGHHAALAKTNACVACSTSPATPVAARAPQPVPEKSPIVISQSVSYQAPSQDTALVPAALASYVPPAAPLATPPATQPAPR
jgi:hypothetical protein